MKIADGKDVSLAIFDIETMKELFDFGIYDPDKKEWIEFEISKRRNDLYKFVNYYQSNPYDYWVSFNGIDFDHQVTQFVLYNMDKWFDKTNIEICTIIYNFVQKLIDDGRYNIQPPYRESQFPVKPLDLYKVNHFDNDAKRTSLKWCAFMMNMDVEEMPIHHSRENLTDEEIDLVISYRRNDVIVTLGLLYVTIGQPEKILELNGGYPVDELMDYKGANKLQPRFDISKETGLSCLNWSDVKIGEEVNKLRYVQAKNIKNEYDLIPKKVKYAYGQKFKNFFPKTMKFKTEQLNKFVTSLGEHHVLAEDQEFPITIGQTTYTVAKGGIHSTEKNRKIVTLDGYILDDEDVGAQYPNSIIKLLVYPPHLDSIILDQFKETVQLKDVYKKKGKEAKAAGDDAGARLYKSLEGLTKLQMNGGFYGKLGQDGSFLSYPEGALRVCMGNQIEILMLIESLDMEGFNVVSGNTDGILTYYPKTREEDFRRICSEWEVAVGNNVLGKLECSKFDGIWQESVNSYIAKKTDGSVKKKGRFVTTYGMPGCEMNKNKSMRIIPMALEAYFIDKVSPIDFITNHKQIFDFCIAKKSAGDFHYEELVEGKDTIEHKKLIVYYICNSGNVFKKRGFNAKGKPYDAYCEAQDKDYPEMGVPKQKYFNKAFSVDDFSKYDVDYSYYILKTLKRIDAIEKTKKAQTYVKSLRNYKQGGLF